MSKRDKKKTAKDRRKVREMRKEKRPKKGKAASNPTISPATATLVLTQEGELRIDLTLLPCSRCGRKGRVGDTPMALGTSEWGRVETCFRFERSTEELICKQCLNEIGYSDDQAEDDKWLQNLQTSNVASSSILEDTKRKSLSLVDQSSETEDANCKIALDGGTSQKTNREQIESACAYASTVFESEKRRRLGRGEESAIAYFFTHQDIVKLSETPFEDLPDGNDHLRFALPLFAQALGAFAVLSISEAWQASRCAVCGEVDGGQFRRNRCDSCAAEAVAPVDNPHRFEVFLGQLQFRDGERSRVWFGEIQRNAAGLVTNFVDRVTGAIAQHSYGRLTGLWNMPSEQTESFVRCLPIVERELGRPLPSRILELSELLENCPLSQGEDLRIDLVRLRAYTQSFSWPVSQLTD